MIAPREMSDRSDHPTAGRKRKTPPVHHLNLPALPDQLREDDDGPTCSDEEKEAKRLRSASTTPRSFTGADPDDNDRVVGVSSWAPTKRLGLLREMQLTWIRIRKDLLATQPILMIPKKELAPSCYRSIPREDDPAAGRGSGGYGRATLLECLSRFGEQSNPVISAACASGEGVEGICPMPTCDTKQCSIRAGQPQKSKTVPAESKKFCGGAILGSHPPERVQNNSRRLCDPKSPPLLCLLALQSITTMTHLPPWWWTAWQVRGVDSARHQHSPSRPAMLAWWA